MDFSVSRIEDNKFYPALKSVGESIKYSGEVPTSRYFDYQPGNGTRYQVLFNTYSTNYGRHTNMTIVNMRKSMELAGEMGMHSLSYMQEKLGLGEGDCYALIPLINDYFENLGK